MLNSTPVKSMWLFAFFDLPVQTKKNKKDYTLFRKDLLAEGFLRLQYSVYARFCESRERSLTALRRVKAALPPEGEVRFLNVTDKQFSEQIIYLGSSRKNAEKPPEQLMLF